ncbi:alpha/beta hydrolase [Gordonia sp. LSe1-13]|uniref:Alpha/beta hydrolase n=1 Tax=Gordonia sesuvii TaxID=3116777 RepID=A0ABU7M9J7_9ACTN|nr:alpha/beta hydrolase [Gordonia sp. LSe1-13]
MVITQGIVRSFTAAGDGPADVVLSGTEESWEKTLSAVPPPYHVNVLSFSSGVVVKGEVVDTVGPFAPAILRFGQLLRELHSGPPVSEPVDSGDPWPETDNAVGRYVRVKVHGVTYRVYYEEAGHGSIPLLLQATAGTDSRQWRNVLANPELQKRFRMIAFDLPYHGKSLPPADGFPWWESEYAVSKEDLMDRVVAISDAIGLDRPIFMGCSVGGQLATDLAAHHGSKFRALVSINGWYESSALTSIRNYLFHHPRIWPEYFGAFVMAATSPVAPEVLRRETYWIYSSGGPGVYRGDNDYMSLGHDLREDGHLIDTTVSPLWVLAGEYDPTAREGVQGGARAIADNIDGAHYRVLEGLGHFMMSDDPVGFCAQITPILDEVVADLSARQTAGLAGS